MPSTSSSKRKKTRLALLLLATCLLSYANGFSGAFTYDDKAIVRDNPRIRSPRRAREILTTGYFGRPRAGTNYRPILLASFAVQWWIHGGRATAFYVVNVLLHASVTLLLARLLLCARFPLPQTAGAAFLFAVHPIHVEAVTSVVGRGETLAAFFLFLFLLLALSATARPRFSWWRLLLSLSCYLLGALTKESAAVAPALLFLFLFKMEEGETWRRVRGALRRGSPFFVGAAVVLCGVFFLRSRVLGGYLRGPAPIFELENPLAPLPAGERVVNACAILFRYLGRIVFPLFLSADESAWSIPLVPAASLSGLGAAMLVLLLFSAGVGAISTAPAAAFGILFFGVAFLPMANVLFPIGTVFAERLAYLPSAGICLLLAAVVLGNSSRFEGVSRGRLALLFSLVLLFAARSVVRNTVWQNDLLLFANSVSTSPGSAKAHYNLAYTLAEAGDDQAALARYIRATQIYPRYFDAWAGRGRMEKELGDLAQAEASYLRSLAILPAYENGFFGLGAVREARGNWRGAEEAYENGLRRNPGSLPLAFRLASARSRLAPGKAERDWKTALAVGPGSVPVRMGYAGWLLARGRREEARRQAREALRRAPASLAALRFLADRNAEERLYFAEGLARERIFHITRSAEDFRELLRSAARDREYDRRLRRLQSGHSSRATGAEPGAAPLCGSIPLNSTNLRAF